MLKLIKKTMLVAKNEGLMEAFNSICYYFSKKARRLIRWYITDTYGDHRFGIMSSGIVKIPSIHNDDVYFGHYCHLPTDYKLFKGLMKRLRIWGNKDVFLDFGSGKGRVVIMAATYPFRKVIGVEISEELNSIAEANLRHAKSKLKCKDVQLVKTDAILYSVSPDITVFYFYNPFGKNVLSKVLENIKNSLYEFPRKITIIYNKPDFEDIFNSCNWLVKTCEHKYWGRLVYVVYQSVSGLPPKN